MNIIYYMNMTDNKTRTITYYKLKPVDDDNKELFIYSALSIKQLRYKKHKTKVRMLIGIFVKMAVRENGSL